jgi:hypothetical protein
MKIIAYILALTILGLSVYPCSDGLCCDEEQKATSHNQSEDEEDNCSIYCLCACCGSSFVENKIKASELINKQALFTFNFHYSFHYSFSYQSTIWHPPTYC